MVHVTAHPKPLTLLSVVKSNFESLVWLQLCNPQGVALFSFVHVPPRVSRPFAGAPVYDMSLTRAERLRAVGCGLKGKLVRMLSLGFGRQFELHRNRPAACHKMMYIIARRVAAELAAALRHEAAKKAEELCASGQCAAAVVPLQRAIDLGDLPSRALKAWLLIHGREGFANDLKRGFELAKEGVRLGCHHCQGVMAKCYFWGNGCRINHARSLELARESSGRGSRYGQYALGLHTHHEKYGKSRQLLAQNDAQAAALYRLAAVQGLGEAQAKLGDMHRNGEGVARDHSERLRWLLLAAAQGLTDAMFSVAICYERKRIGVEADVAEAIRWCRRAQAADPMRGTEYYESILRRLEEKMERKQGSRK
jgi:TPR repeat protein